MVSDAALFIPPTCLVVEEESAFGMWVGSNRSYFHTETVDPFSVLVNDGDVKLGAVERFPFRCRRPWMNGLKHLLREEAQ